MLGKEKGKVCIVAILLQLSRIKKDKKMIKEKILKEKNIKIKSLLMIKHESGIIVIDVNY